MASSVSVSSDDLAVVLAPIQIGGVEIKNRIARTAHRTLYAEAVHLVTDQLIAYHRQRAIGGVGLSILELASVHESSWSGLHGFNDAIVDGWHELASAVHEHGMAMFQQLWHGGHHTMGLDNAPPWGVSSMPGISVSAPPVTMTKNMIDELIAGFAASASRAQLAGLDGVELHAAHGYLIAQFLSPAINDRSDDYGGPFENRIRFLAEALRATRDAVGPTFPIGIRLSAKEWINHGLEPDDASAVLETFKNQGLVDFVDVSAGTHNSFPHMFGLSHTPAGFQLPESAKVTAHADVPTIVTGRFTSLTQAADVIRRGQASLVSMVRELIVEPHLVKKAIAGQVPSRPCIGCNQGCLGGTGWMGCVVNAVAGRESHVDVVIGRAKVIRLVLVVGGGPAGLEAARVAAEAGHDVTLVESAGELGGALRLIRRVPGRQAWGDFSDWLVEEIHRLDVRVITDFETTPQTLVGLGPFDHALIAAGAKASTTDLLQIAILERSIPGIERARIVRVSELLSCDDKFAEEVVVYDDVGGGEGFCVADTFVERGVRVHFVTRFLEFSPSLEPTHSNWMARQRWAHKPIAIYRRSCVRAVTADGILIGSLDGAPDTLIQTMTLAPITFAEPNTALASTFAASARSVALIGDARSPRTLQIAVTEGHFAARAI